MNATNICPVCQKELNFTRRQLTQLATLIKKIKGERYFLSDETTGKIVHDFHTQLEKNT
jgi:hypothetical protein